MHTFHSLLCLMGFTRVTSECMDLVARLPLEVASIVFRKLDDRSLFNASKVDDVWMGVIKGDGVLRTRLRRYVRTFRDCDPLNLGRFVSTGQRNRSGRAKSNVGKNPEFTAATTFGITGLDYLSRPLKRRRPDDDATSGMNRKIKMIRYY